MSWLMGAVIAAVAVLLLFRYTGIRQGDARLQIIKE